MFVSESIQRTLYCSDYWHIYILFVHNADIKVRLMIKFVGVLHFNEC